MQYISLNQINERCVPFDGAQGVNLKMSDNDYKNKDINELSVLHFKKHGITITKS